MSRTSHTPSLNTLQLSWLKELGIEMLWGTPMRATPINAEVVPKTEQKRAETQSIVSRASSEVPVVAAPAPKLTPVPQSPSAPAVMSPAMAERSNRFKHLRQMVAEGAQPKSPQVSSVMRTLPSVQVQDWAELREQVLACQACELAQQRGHVLFADGAESAELMIVDEMPGQEDDLSGHYFQGPAGELLDNMLKTIGLSRQQVVLTSLLKCRSIRAPSPALLAQCHPYLIAQLRMLSVKCILVLGRAAYHLLDQKISPFEDLLLQDWVIDVDQRQIPIIVCPHPSTLLKNSQQKAIAWQELLKVKARLA